MKVSSNSALATFQPPQLDQELLGVGGLDLPLGHRREVGEELELVGAEVARPMIGHRERSEGESVGIVEDMTGVGADPRSIGHDRTVGEPRISGGVLHHELPRRLEDGVPAERHRARRLAAVESDAGLEPLAIGVDQAHDRHRHAERPRRESDDPVEALLGTAVEQRRAIERVEARALVVMHGRGQHRVEPSGRAGRTHGPGIKTGSFPLFGGSPTPIASEPVPEP